MGLRVAVVGGGLGGLRDGDFLRHSAWLYGHDVDAEPLLP